MIRLQFFVSLGLAAAVTAGVSHAAVMTQRNIAPAGAAPGDAYDPASVGGPDNFSASSTDLLQGLTATYSGNTFAGGLTDDYPSPGGEVSTGVSAWTDGAIVGRYAGDIDGDGLTSNDIDDFTIMHDGYGTVSNGGIVTYDLGGLYDITAVDVFLGWNDSGRDDASFVLSAAGPNQVYSVVETYTKGANAGGGLPVMTRVAISDGGANLAAGVRYLQFEFTDADNQYAGVLEIDAFGTPGVPEPSSALLAGLLAFSAAYRRRG